MREKEQSTQRCAQLGSGARLKDNVHTIDSEAGSTVALLLHPFRPLVTSVDGGGTVRVHNYRHSTVINRFHVTGMVTLLVCCLFSFQKMLHTVTSCCHVTGMVESPLHHTHDGSTSVL